MRDVPGAYRFRSLGEQFSARDLLTRVSVPRGLITNRDIANPVLPISTGYRFNGAPDPRAFVWRTGIVIPLKRCGRVSVPAASIPPINIDEIEQRANPRTSARRSGRPTKPRN
jgi:hypothetical protein